MCKKLIYLCCFVLLVGYTNAADENLVGWWKLDETSGTTAADSSGNGYDGTLMNGGTWVAGQLDGALQLDGDDDYVELDIGSLIPTLQECTFTIWVNWNGGDNWQRFIDIGTSQANYIYFVPSDGAGLRIALAVSGVWEEFTADEPLPSDGWHHVALTVSDSEEEMHLYLDGEPIDEYTGMNNSVDGLGETTNNWLGRSAYPVDPYFDGILDDFQIYNRILSQEDILEVMEGISGTSAGKSSKPNPDNGAPDILRDVILIWRPGQYPGTHNVYFGTDFDDVNDGTALMSEQQDTNTYDPGTLEFGTTYYWRIDEVNDSADATVYRGSVWSFTTEAYSLKIPSSSITATASSWDSEDEVPENTINESGLDPNHMNQHSTETISMWATAEANMTDPAWIQYDFDKVYKLHQMLVWNYNGESLLKGFGIKDVNIVYSEDGETWNQIISTTQFERASGQGGYEYSNTVDFNGVAVKSVRINAINNWGGQGYPQYGLSEVRFMYIPVHAREPYPDADEEDVPIDVTLSWRAGREAQQHIVSLNTDQQAVSDGNAVITTIDEVSHGPLSLDIATVYYWRIDEVNDFETPTIWIGDTWSFTTQEYIVVEDFEFYDDEEPNRIWDFWEDGWDDDDNGSTIGHPDPDFDNDEHFVETEIVHGGEQSAPFLYDNSSAPLSEVSVNTVDLPIGSDWITGSPNALRIWFIGDVNNTGTNQLYAKINGVRFNYKGNTGDISKAVWKRFDIDITDPNIAGKLDDIESLAIGLEKVGSDAGLGTIFIDDIQLLLLNPTDPGTDNLMHSYTFEDGTANDSVGGANGTLVGDPLVENGSLYIADSSQWMEMPADVIAINSYEELTLEAWYTPDEGANTGYTMLVYFGETVGSTGRNYIFISTARGDNISRGAITTTGAGNEADDFANGPEYDDGYMHHIVCTIDATEIKLYIDGILTGTGTLRATNSISGVSNTDAYLAKGGYTADPSWVGSIHEFNIFNRALTADEVLYLSNQ